MITKTVITQPELDEVLKVYEKVKKAAAEQEKSIEEILNSLTKKEVKETKKAKNKS